MNEEWRAIPGFGGRYDVSDEGRIRSWVPWRNRELPHLMSPQPNARSGHPMQVLTPYRGAKKVAVYVHTAMMLAFVGPRPDGLVVRHIDGDSLNNRLSNLAYGTASENEFDKVRHGTHQNASKTHCKRGHEFTPENTRPNGPSGRSCRECSNARSRIPRPCPECGVELSNLRRHIVLTHREAS